MILDDKKNLVNVVNPLPSVGNMLHINWNCRTPEGGRIAGFLVVYDRGGKNHAACMEQLRALDDAHARALLAKGGWLSGVPTGNEPSLIWAVPVGVSDYAVHEGTFRAPCRIEVWTVLDQDGSLRVLYQDSPAYHRSLKLHADLTAKEFAPAEYGLFHRVKRPAISGVELTLRTEEQGAIYEDGAVFYRLKSDPAHMEYPIARSALGKPLQFRSTDSFRYIVNDFEVQIAPDYAGMYQL